MYELQRRLEARFASLRVARTGPIFFIEHGLTEAELDELNGALREILAVHPPEAPCWNDHPLPLLVAATEVGYRYRGSGTDFWPLLEQQLGASFGGSARHRVRDLFEVAANKHHGACPPDSPWARVFRLITWPITHALVPIEFHRPLAATLANLRASVRGLKDRDLYRAVRFAAGEASARFDTWLSDSVLVVTVARALLGLGPIELAEEALQRIKQDLSRDEIARRDVAVAQRIQRVERVGRRISPRRPNLPVVRGRLQLRRRADQFTLEASFPLVDHHDLLEPMRRALRRRRYAPRLWGASARVPSEQFLSGLPFSLKLESPPDDSTELLPGLDDLDLDADQVELLRALRLDFRPPVLFAVDADGEVGRDIRGVEISGYRRYWLIASPDIAATLRALPNVGELGPYKCVELDASLPNAAEALERLGYQVSHGLAIGFVGAPSLEKDAATPQFAVGETLFVTARRRPPEGVIIEVGGEAVRLGDDLVRFAVQEGENLLTLSSSDKSRTYRFQGVRQVASETPRTCWIELDAPELTVQALLGGRFSLRVDSLAPLEGLELTLELEAAGRLIGVSTPLGPLPETIAGDAGVWSSLLDETSRQLAIQADSAILRARVGALACGTWPLERRVRPCWWERSGAEVSLRDDLGVLEFGQVTASRPLERPTSRVTEEESDAVLLAPLAFDHSTYGPSAEFVTLCLSPARMMLNAPAVRKPRLARRRRADSGSAGLEDLVEAYLRWALAESTSLPAEMRRRQMTALVDSWVSELCCGEEWTRREAPLRASTSDPWELLVRTCDESGLGRDPYVALAAGDKADVTRRAVAEIRKTMPELWGRVGTTYDMDAHDYEALDLACGRAYQELAEIYLGLGRNDLAAQIAQGDPGTAPDEWEAALKQIEARVELQGLAALLIPTGSATKLSTLDFSLMSLDDLTEELSRWSRGAKRALAGGTPEAPILEAILTLWLAPERAVNLDWRSALDTLIAERCVSRAARYMCLRSLGGRGRA